MRILVAGATGAVGRLLVPMLLDSGHEVIGLSRSASGLERVRQAGASAVQADAFDRDGMRQVVTTAAPDVVVHQLTALSDADGETTNRLREEGTRNLVDAAKSAGAQRIIAQSIAWAYAPGEQPADEAVSLDFGAEQPRGAMVDGIRRLEETSAEMQTAVALRYGILYGPGTWYAPGGAVAAALSGDSKARLLAYLEADRSVTSFIHVADAARATVAAVGWPSGPVNIVDDEPAEGRQWVPVLAEALGTPAPELGTGRQDWARGASNALAHSRGWQPEYATWRTGFAEQGHRGTASTE
ncbi:NAD-dependent epimerase/dehydratase family protein [Streptomyces violaceoruber]|uniref:NAD-dependent epimerase/dehydratase family protein n=1 Tax=Streptomyces TaxID=1883 RepID=UPI00087DCABD|nr:MULTISPECIES: NAD(P)-dependent oxidoreductase [Streptomyces]MCW8122456.1 NAD(P)-dependent oxidoreductase [Streptomyces anthocyanicus]REH18423.1 nucleoside-diphosphate-sugar epimerase [Streptomyces sp. 2221.1]SDS24244.1 Nucleoside-diphosphate-sugar epimerase [Streptomyces sp. 2114.2]